MERRSNRRYADMSHLIDLNFNYRLHPTALPYGSFMSTEARQERARALDVGALIARMDELGVAMTGVVANVSGRDIGRYGTGQVLDDNHVDLVHAAIAPHADRLFGWVGINPLGGFKTLRYIEYAVNDLGFKGVHIFPHWFVAPVNDRVYYPIWAKCAELGVPVAMQCGIGGSPSASKVVASEMQVEDVLFDFPELTLIALRLGNPWERGFIALARNYLNLVLAADNPPGYWPPDFIEVLHKRTLGSAADITDRVVWGTNGPVVDPKSALDAIDSLQLDQDVKARFLGGNAARILKLVGAANAGPGEHA
jgi:predicted TIM-barrel fold metal-dependent hydrolase